MSTGCAHPGRLCPGDCSCRCPCGNCTKDVVKQHVVKQHVVKPAVRAYKRAEKKAAKEAKKKDK